jgi:hypothetical protein
MVVCGDPKLSDSEKLSVITITNPSAQEPTRDKGHSITTQRNQVLATHPAILLRSHTKTHYSIQKEEDGHMSQILQITPGVSYLTKCSRYQINAIVKS